MKQDYRARLAPPSAEHILGTDRLGRDIYSRLLWGGRRLVTISLLAVAFGLMIGIPYGVLSGYFGGWTDTVGMRVVDGLLAFPGLLLYLLIVTLAREWKLEGIYNDLALVFALGLTPSSQKWRALARGSVLSEKKREYVEASLVMGEKDSYIALRQILPNIVSPLIVNATVRLGFVILIIAALSFLGLGSPADPGLGADLAAARDYMEKAPMIAVWPGPGDLLHGFGLQPLRRRIAGYPRSAAGRSGKPSIHQRKRPSDADGLSSTHIRLK